MSRTIRVALAAAALAAVAAPFTASAEPIVRPLCRLYWGEEIVTTSSDFPVQASVRRPYWVC